MGLITMNEARARYGEVGDGEWADESKWCVAVEIPSDIASGWLNSLSGQDVTHIYCNRDMASPLLCALQNIRDRGLLSELKTFDGCFMIRDVRGAPGVPSWHSYALAIDVNARWNPLGGPCALSQKFIQAWKDAGFIWGGDFKRNDPMHFQLAEG